MKAILPLLIGIAALNVGAQNNPVTPPTPLPPPVAEPADELVVPPPAPGGGPRVTKPGRQKADVKITTGAGGGTVSASGGALKPAEQAAIIAEKVNRLELQSGLPRSTKTGRTLVIQTSDPDPAAIADTEEDLSVMALILRKATGGSPGDDKRMALGIEVDSTVFGSSSGARNIFVEGHGALFLLGVPFPLIAPTDQIQETKLKDAPESEWAQARQEFLNSERTRFEVQLERVWAGGGRPFSEEYDADKVEVLKTALFDALKNATHIRALKPDNYVTVVIQGGETVRGDKPEKSAGRGDSSRKGGRSDSRRAETVMTMRVKKSDVDAFAKGSLDLAGFKKKTAIQTYFRRGDASVGTSFFFAPPAK